MLNKLLIRRKMRNNASLRVYVYIFGLLTATSNGRILSNFKNLIKSRWIVSPKNPLRIEKNYT